MGKLNTRFMVAALAVLIGVALLLKLGFWQLDRLAWKEQLIADMARYQAESVDLAAYTNDPTAEFRRGTLKGFWDSDGTFRTRNVTMNANFGYWIMTPLILPDGSQIYVNRGWVHDGQQDRVLKHALPNSNVVVHGTLRRLGILEQEKHMRGYQAPWVLFMEKSEPADHPELMAAPVAAAMRNDHKQYAIFWFTMAGILLAFFGVASLRGRRSVSSPDPSGP